MQHTLLGIGIALILALIAALVGPIFVNWNAHRAFFEAEATRLVGAPVHVAGAIDARLLPTPSITLRGIAIGERAEASRLRAGALSFQLGLVPLMRGEIKAVEMRLIGPEIALGLRNDSVLDWPSGAMSIKGETLSIERLSIEEGRVILTDAATATRLVLDKLSFRGEARSLIGPIRGEGGFAIGANNYRYRVTTSRFAGDGLKLRLSLDVTEQPLIIEAEGTLSFDYGSPRFEGSLTLARPVGAVLASGKATVNEPWRANSKIKGSAAGVMFDQVEFQYGPEDRALKLAGTAEVKFGEQPRLQGLFHARHIDLDKLTARPNMIRQLPFAAVKTFAEMFGDSLKPALPTRLAISVDSATLGGAMLQAISSDLSANGSAWSLDKLEFRAPGFTQVRANGEIELTAKGLGFAGFANVNAADSMTLLAWLTGRANPTPGVLKAWQARGEVTLSSDRVAVERLRTVFDRATLEGRFAYAASNGSRPARLKAELNAAELDVDGWLQVGETVFGGLALERPQEVELALDIGKARIAGIETRKVLVHLKLDDGGLDLKRLSVDAFGNAALEASGRIQMRSGSPRGEINISLDTPDLNGVIALANRYAPTIADPLRRLASAQPAARLRANLGVESSGADAGIKRTTARVRLEGQVGAFRLQVAGASTANTDAPTLGDLAALLAGELRFDGQIDTEDGAELLKLLGLDRVMVAEKRPGRLKLVASGPLDRNFRIDGRLNAGPIDLNGMGNARLFGEQTASANFNRIFGTIGGNKVQGRISLAFGMPVRVEGAMETDRLDVPAALSSVIGMPVERMKTVEAGMETWSQEPFPQVATGIAGRIEVRASRAILSAGQTALGLRGVLQFAEAKVSFEIVESQFAGGRLTGDIAFFSSPDGFASLSYVELAGAKAADLIPRNGRPPITGTVSMKATVEGVGLTPAAFMGSLQGNGEITIENGEFAGLSPNVFDALTRAVDLGVKADTRQIREFVATLLEHGYLPVTLARSKIALVGGQARLVGPRVETHGAELAVEGTVDLANATVDATLKLSGAPAGDVAGRPAVTVVLKGAFAAPKSTVNADSLVGWLALRSVEQQSKRLETIEAARRSALTQPLVDLPVASFVPTLPDVRPGDDTNTNLSAVQAPSAPAEKPAGATAGVVASERPPPLPRLPPLPPPIMVDPMSGPMDSPYAPARRGGAPFQ